MGVASLWVADSWPLKMPRWENHPWSLASSWWGKPKKPLMDTVLQCFDLDGDLE